MLEARILRTLSAQHSVPHKNWAKPTDITEDTAYKLVICNPVAYCLWVKPRGSPDKWRSNVIREQQWQTLSPDDARAALIRATCVAMIDNNKPTSDTSSSL